MIGFMGLGVDADEAFREAEAFFTYIEDPDADLALVLAVEEAFEVVL
ncbi:DUF7215 family protein [Streptomyces chrestomyceticus]